MEYPLDSFVDIEAKMSSVYELSTGEEVEAPENELIV